MSSLKTANRLKTARAQNLAAFAETLMFIGFKGRQRVKTATANCWRGFEIYRQTHRTFED